MTQRFREIGVASIAEQYIEHEVHEGNNDVDYSEPPPYAGGQTFTRQDHHLMIRWLVNGNTAEISVGGFSEAVHSTILKLICPESAICSGVTAAYSKNDILIMFATRATIHCVTLNASAIQTGLSVKSSESHPVDTGAALIHCSALLTDDYGVVYSLVNDQGSVIAATVQHQVYEARELKQSSLMGSIWNRVRRSMMSGPDDSNHVVSSALSDEHPSLYCLTKGFQIQQWNLTNWECESTNNLQSYISSNQLLQGEVVQIFSSDVLGTLLGVQFSDGNQTKIMILSVGENSGCIQNCLVVVDCDGAAVISYNVMSELLFILGCNNNQEYNLAHISLASSTASLMKVHLHKINKCAVIVDYHQDPREVYTQIIFSENRFNSSSILRAVHTLNPSSTQTYPITSCYSMTELQEITWAVVNAEVINSVAAEEVSNDEFKDLQIKIWEKLYSNLIQYQQASMEPLAIVSGNENMPAALIRKAGASYLRPCEPLELQILFPSDPLDNSSAVNQDVVALSQALAVLKQNVEGFEDHVFQALMNSESVYEAINQVVQSIVKRSDHGIQKTKFTSYLQNIHLLQESISILQHFLNPVSQLPADPMDTSPAATDISPGESMFSSLNMTAHGILRTSLYDMAQSRYNLCCSLLLFLEYLTYLSEEISKSEELETDMEEMTLTITTQLRAYAIIMWICRLQSSADSEADGRMMTVLKIGNGDRIEKMRRSGEMNGAPVFTGFLSGIGGTKVQSLMIPTTHDAEYYPKLNSILIAACQALWSETGDVVFAEYLLANNELLSLQTYCRLLDGHSKAAASARTYLLGQSHLLQKEEVKAYSCFMTALYGMFEDNPPPVQTVNDDQAGSTISSQQLQFCFKVMNMFEELSYSEQVVSMAHQTMKFTNLEKETLWTKIFKHSVELGHYDEAFKSILTNTDHNRKMNCLHQFVNALCDKGELRTLVSYPYKDVLTQQDLRPSVISILLSKARSVDLTVRNYYDLLFAFHTVNNDLLSAANVMYECCERLSSELSGLSALQKRAKCYLACIHALECVPKQSAWISPPAYDSEAKMMSIRRSPKRTTNGRNKIKPAVQPRILLLSDVKKEYMLVNMSLRLAQNGCKQITGSSLLQAEDIVGLLCNTGMYDEAIELCAMYNLPLTQIFQSLTFRCLRMSRELNDDVHTPEDEEMIKWLTYNRLPTETSYSSSCDQAWKILRHYLERHETMSSTYHKVVANKLLSNGTSLPEWFVASYKVRNAGELIRLYTQHDLIEEAIDVSTNLLNSLTSAHYDKFGFESALTATMDASAVCVPYTAIDILLNILDEYQQDPYYHQLYTKLKTAVDLYMSELEEKSGDAEKRLRSAGKADNTMMTSMMWT